MKKLAAKAHIKREATIRVTPRGPKMIKRKTPDRKQKAKKDE